MSKEEILQTLNEVFRTIFDDEELMISENTTALDIEDWNSLTHISLVAACENKFHIKFTISEIGKMKNVNDMVLAIMQKLQTGE